MTDRQIIIGVAVAFVVALAVALPIVLREPAEQVTPVPAGVETVGPAVGAAESVPATRPFVVPLESLPAELLAAIPSAGPATRPEPVELRGVFKSLPAELIVYDDGDTQLASTMKLARANEWMDSRLKGRTIRCAGTVRDVVVGDTGYVTVATVDSYDADGASLWVLVAVAFPPSMAGELAKLRPGEVVSMSGDVVVVNLDRVFGDSRLMSIGCQNGANLTRSLPTRK